MRLLIIDNSSKPSDLLVSIASRYESETVAAAADELRNVDNDAFDAFIISGHYDDGDSDVLSESEFLQLGTDMVGTSEKLILGIGQGFEMVYGAAGCKVSEVSERASGAGTVTPTEDGAKVFQGTDPIKVRGSQRWNIDEAPRELMVLAASESGIEAVKFRSKPIYGIQFQPEDFVYESDGKMVFDNVLTLLAKQCAKR